MRPLPLRQLLQAQHVVADQCLLLGARPPLDLSLIGDGIGDPLKPLRIDQANGPSRFGVSLVEAGIVLSNSDIKCGARGAGVKAAVRAAHDVNKRPVRH